MASGFLLSINVGNNKADIVITNAAVPTAGMEILVDSTKFTTPQQCLDALKKAAEAITEGGITNTGAYPPA